MSELITGSSTFGYETRGVEFEEIFMRPIYTDPTVQSLFKVETGIANKATLAIDNEFEYLVKAAPDCDSETTGDNITLSKAVLEVCELGFDRSICFKDLKGYFRDANLKLDPNYMTNDNYIKDYFVKKIQVAMNKDVTRIAFFGDTTLGNANYNSCDGIWKRIIASVGAYGIRRTSILAATVTNAGLTAVTAKAMIDVFGDIYYNQSTTLKNVPTSEKQFIVSGSVYNAIEQAYDILRANNGFLEGLQNANGTLTYKGVKITPMYKWDEYIANDLGGTFPNRIILTWKDALVIGFDGESETEMVEVLEDKVGKKYIYRGYFKMGSQILHNDLIAVGY